MNYKVRILRNGTDEVVREYGPTNLERAQKLEKGANVNLNHNEFHTDIVKDDTKDSDEIMA